MAQSANSFSDEKTSIYNCAQKSHRAKSGALTRWVVCRTSPYIPEPAEKGFPWNDPLQGSRSTESSLCSAFPSTPWSTAWLTSPQRSVESKQSPFMLPNRMVIFGFRQPLILFVESWKNWDCIHGLPGLRSCGTWASSTGWTHPKHTQRLLKKDATFLKPLLALPKVLIIIFLKMAPSGKP